MSKAIKFQELSSPRLTGYRRLMVFAVVFLSFIGMARAEDDPFQMEKSHWMSFDHYNDASKRGVIEQPPPPPAVPETSVDSGQPAPGDQNPVKNADNTDNKMAPLARPIDLPVMPGLNKGFEVQVNSTTEDHKTKKTEAQDAPSAPPAESNWQPPASVRMGSSKGKVAEGEEEPPLNVRNSYLPDSKITPIPSDTKEGTQKIGRLALEEALQAQKKKAQTPQEAAACAAIDAYKKQQLDAIQSDRQTLKALQDAIKSLGLEKQLGFMAGVNGTLNEASNKQNYPQDLNVSGGSSVR